MSAPAKEITAVATLEGSPTYMVDLPMEVPPEMLGLHFNGSPPTIANIEIKSPLQGRIQSGHYIHGVKLVNIEIMNLVSCDHLTEVLRANASYPRQLVVSSSPTYTDPMIGRRYGHPLFKHQLPTNAHHVGFVMRGFPPVITSVTDGMKGRLFPGQTVEGLYIPGRPLMNLQAGGFTSNNVYHAISETSGIEGRQLVVRDGHKVQQDTTSNAPFDDCVIS